MKFKVLIFVLLTTFGTHCHSNEAKASVEAKHAANYLLTDISKVKNGFVAVGKWGNIVFSNDGQSWQKAQVPVQVLLTGVYFLDAKTGWAVGHDSTIIHTQDGGSTWQIQQYLPEVDKPLLDIYFFNEKEGLAVGAYGLQYRTMDAGKSWQKEFSSSLLYPEDGEYLAEIKQEDPEGYEIETASILPHFNSLYDDGSRLYLAGEVGLLAFSQDKGKTWTRFNEIYHGSFFSINQLENKQLIAGGLRGTVFVSNDLGKSWYRVETTKNATINSITVDKNTAYLSANNGVVFIYKNGQIIEQQLEDGKAVLASVVDDKRLILATEAGVNEVVVK